MIVHNFLLKQLQFLGRNGPRALVASLLLGFALPQIATPLRPLLPIIVFFFIALNIARVEVAPFKRLLRCPLWLSAAFAWTTMFPVAVVFLAVAVVGREAIDDGLLVGLAIAVVAPPLVGIPSYAMLLGLSGALSVLLLLAGMMIAPLFTPWAGSLLVAGELINTGDLVQRLALLLFGAMSAGLIMRIWITDAVRVNRKAELDGIGILSFFVFAIIFAEGAATALRENILKALNYTIFSFLLCGTIFSITYAVWRRWGGEDAISLGMTASLRNTGLLVAIIGIDKIPGDAFLLLSVLQFPVYVTPYALMPLASRISRRATETYREKHFFNKK